jgi:benzoate membrane transport protein
MRLSAITAALTATLVGIAGALAVVLAAAEAVGATKSESTSWVTGLWIAMALTSMILSAWHRIPIITAWSTPGAAVISATSGVGLDAAAGAFLLAGALLMLTALIAPLGRLIERIPVAVASAMLAGVLVRFVIAMFDGVKVSPELVLPLIALFLVVRLWSPPAAMMGVLAAGIGLAVMQGAFPGGLALELSSLQLVTPVFDLPVLIGVGVPLYLVTMASQNLPGAAVLRAAGYAVPMASSLAVTGLASIAVAFVGAHTVNLSAITAAICTGPDAHPDASKRWTTGIAYGVIYLGIAAIGASIVALFLGFPVAIIKAIAGLGLMGSLTGALAQAMQDDKNRFAAVLTFAVTASGVTVLGVGAAFWGLVAGLVVLGLDRVATGLRA